MGDKVKNPEDDERVFLTFEEAEAMLPEGEMIHTFVSTGFGLMGADHTRESILELLKNGKPELSGELATGMGHGLVAFRKVDEEKDWKSDALFIQTKGSDD